MLTVRVMIRLVAAQAQGLPVLAQVKGQDKILQPNEDVEFEFTEEQPLELKAELTEEGKEFKKAIEEADKVIAGEQKEGKKKDLKSGEPTPGDIKAREAQETVSRLTAARLNPGQAPVHPGPKVEDKTAVPKDSRAGIDSKEVKGETPLRK